jgi:hypothetical protein
MSTYRVQFDFPLNGKGQGVSAEFAAEIEEKAIAQALELYKNQFGDNATGKIEKITKYRTESEIREFCREKYGTVLPTDIGFGYIVWLHVPAFARSYSPNHISNIPIIRDRENEKWQEAERRLSKRKLKLEERQKRYLEITSHLVPDKRLTPEQLALIGIDFDPHANGLKTKLSFIEMDEENVNPAPNPEKTENASNKIKEKDKIDFSKVLTMEQYKDRYGEEYSDDGPIVTAFIDHPLTLAYMTYREYKKVIKGGVKYAEALCDVAIRKGV